MRQVGITGAMNVPNRTAATVGFDDANPARPRIDGSSLEYYQEQGYPEVSFNEFINIMYNYVGLPRKSYLPTSPFPCYTEIETPAQLAAIKAFAEALKLNVCYGFRESLTDAVGIASSRFRLDYSSRAFWESVDAVKLSFEEFLRLLTTWSIPTEEVVPLNASYSAVVSASGIKVGCQTFSLDVVEKLAEAKKNLNLS